MQEKKKQERAIVHLEIDGRHYYYGNLKAMTDEWPKEKIGASYSYLKNLNIVEEHPYQNAYCVIRRGSIVTSLKKNENTYIYKKNEKSVIFNAFYFGEFLFSKLRE